MNKEEYNEYDDVEESEQHRYIFTVRQFFGQDPHVDCFHDLSVPSVLTGDQAQIMKKLSPDWCIDEIRADTQAYNGMDLRLRMNGDFFPHICLVRTNFEITADDLDMILKDKHHDGTLSEFLDESKV